MSEIYTNQEGQQVYDYAGKTYNANTGEILGLAPVTREATSIYDLGYSQPDTGELQGFEELQPKPLISSSQGEDYLNQANQTYQNLQPQIGVDVQKQEQKPVQKTTGQYTFDEAFGLFGNDFTGLQRMDDGRFTPDASALSRIGVKTDTTQQDYELAKSSYQDALNKLRVFDVSKDPALQSLLSGIEQGWNSRIMDMQKINKSREASVQTLGIRLGTAQYASGIAGGILTAEEREGANRVAELEGKKQAALAEAKFAYEKQKWDQYSKLVDVAEKQYQEQLKAVQKINENSIEQQNKLKEQMRLSEIDTSIGSLLNQGITDPLQILQNLPKGLGVTSKQLAETIKNLTTPDEKLQGEAANFQSFLDVGLISKNLSKSQQWEEYKKLTKKDDQSIFDKLSVDFRDFNYLSALPGRGGLPNSIQNPLQYMRYIKQMEEDIKNTPAASSYRGTPFEGSISSLEDIQNAPVSDITKAVMTGYISMKELTPSDKSKVASELYQVGFNPKQYINNKLTGLISLYAAMPYDVKGIHNSFTNLSFWVFPENLYPEVARFNSAAKVLTREIARLNDVGVLSDQDVATYSQAMPSRWDDSIQIVINKLSGLRLATGGTQVENAGKTVRLPDGREALIGPDGETLLDAKTGKPL